MMEPFSLILEILLFATKASKQCRGKQLCIAINATCISMQASLTLNKHNHDQERDRQSSMQACKLDNMHLHKQCAKKT